LWVNCQEYCLFDPLIRKLLNFSLRSIVLGGNNFWSLCRYYCGESRLVLLAIRNCWRFSSLYPKYQEVSKYCSCHSTSDLALNDVIHTFSCSIMLSTRTNRQIQFNQDSIDKSTNMYLIEDFIFGRINELYWIFSYDCCFFHF